MDNNLFQRIKDLIEANQTVGVLVSPNPSLDEMAAGLGLYLSLKQMGKNVSIVCPGEITVGVSSLVGIDKVQKSFGGTGAGGDLVVSFPYKEGEIEKVSYNVDGGKLQIVIKAGQQGLSFNKSDVDYKQGGGVGAVPNLLFFLGIANLQQVGYPTTPVSGTTIVNIDNKSTNTKYGDVVHVDSKFSSLSEEVADFLTLLEPQIELDVDSSQNLLSGILSATNDFQDGKGSYLAFEMAGILMKKGAVRSAAGQYAHPTPTAMPTNAYFPPQPVQTAPAQQPSFGQVQPGSQSVFQPAAQQPVMQGLDNSFQPQQQPVQTAPAQQQSEQPPADWLTPKVYKGSTVI